MKMPLSSCCTAVLTGRGCGQRPCPAGYPGRARMPCSLQDGELAALDHLHDGRVDGVAVLVDGELAEDGRDVLQLAEGLLDGLAVGGAAGAHGLVDELQTGVGLRGELVGLRVVLRLEGLQERLVLRVVRGGVPGGTDDDALDRKSVV